MLERGFCMVYKTEHKEIGLTIKISSHRKHGNGAVGGGRKNTSGKKAVISKIGNENVVITACTMCQLLKDIRSKFNIPPYIKINEKGETCI